MGLWLHRVLVVAALVCPLIFLTACRSTPPTPTLHRFVFTHPSMGTLFQITLYAPDAALAQSAAEAAFQRITDLDDRLSDYQADSELMRLRDHPAGVPVPVSDDLFDVLQQAETVSRMSGGAFDVTVGPSVRLWRFARKRKELPTPTQLAEAMAASGWEKLRLDARNRTVTLSVPGMRLDVGGIAKGYAADQAMRALNQRGITRAIVAASGDLAIGDPPPGERGWRIGVTGIDAATNSPARMLLLHNVGISTSGDTEQFIEIGGVRYSHILNPATGLGLTERIQATVIAPNATLSDPLATTVCVLGKERGQALIDSLPKTATLILWDHEGQRHSAESRRWSRFPKVSGREDSR